MLSGQKISICLIQINKAVSYRSFERRKTEMEYLLFLQNLRDAAPHWVNEAILFVSEFVGGVGGLVLMTLIYWCINKYIGTLLMMNFSLSYVCNTMIKNVFCIERPFYRDTRLVPYTEVTGYSFPSGHTMLATGFYGGLAVWQRKRGGVVGLCVFLTLLTAFSRNWLGAHTPEDVLVGILCSCAVIAVNIFLLRWVESKKHNDVVLFAASMVLLVVLCVLYPTDLKIAGIYGGVMIGWLIERRFIGFEIKGSFRFRTVTFVAGILVVGVLYKLILPQLFASAGEDLADALTYFITFLVIVAGWPCVIELVSKKLHKN